MTLGLCSPYHLIFVIENKTYQALATWVLKLCLLLLSDIKQPTILAMVERELRVSDLTISVKPTPPVVVN